MDITIPDGITLDVASITSYCKFTSNSGAFIGTDCSGSAQGNEYLVRFTSLAQSGSIGAGTNISLRI